MFKIHKIFYETVSREKCFIKCGVALGLNNGPPTGFEKCSKWRPRYSYITSPVHATARCGTDQPELASTQKGKASWHPVQNSLFITLNDTVL